MESAPEETKFQDLSQNTQSISAKLNIDKSHHAQILLEYMIQTNPNYTQTFKDSDFDIKWQSPKTDEEDLYQNLQDKTKIINRYPRAKQLCRKDLFQQMMELGLSINQKAFDFVPQTFIFPQDKNKFLEYQKKHPKYTYIAKPQSGSQGAQIEIFQDLKSIPYTLEDRMIVQRYIDNPLLVGGLKFDMRIYIVVTGINEGQMSAYIADEGLARFCTEKYQKPNRDNFKKSFMHLTNFTLNKKSNEYNQEPEVIDIFEPNDASKRTLTSLFKQLEQEKSIEKVDQLKMSIKHATTGVLSVFMNMIKQVSNPFRNQVFAGNAFQIFGLDIMIDSKMRSWILEINDHPSFGIITCTQPRGCLHENCQVSQVDINVKERILNDTFQLVLYQRQYKTYGLDSPQNFNSLLRIAPLQETPVHHDIYNKVQLLRRLFMTQCSPDNPQIICQSQFEKMHKYKLLKDKEIDRQSLHIEFIKLSGITKEIDIFQFYKVMYGVYKRIPHKKKGYHFFAFIEELVSKIK